MQSYHYVWLSNHPNRTEQWLKERLIDGFDIHHADGDHSNDDPSNLVLIECNDHMRLHGLSLSRLLHEGCEDKRARKAEAIADRRDLARSCYEMKTSSISWMFIGMELNPSSEQPQAWARSLAKNYAADNNLPFPKPGSNMEAGKTSLPPRQKTITDDLRKAVGL